MFKKIHQHVVNLWKTTRKWWKMNFLNMLSFFWWVRGPAVSVVSPGFEVRRSLGTLHSDSSVTGEPVEPSVNISPVKFRNYQGFRLRWWWILINSSFDDWQISVSSGLTWFDQKRTHLWTPTNTLRFCPKVNSVSRRPSASIAFGLADELAVYV